MPARKLTLYQRIMRAAKRDRGIRLSPEEVWGMSQDDAIARAAMEDDERDAKEAAQAKEAENA